MPMDYSRYPPNWREISLQVREEAGWVCEWCGAANGDAHPVTGSLVVLTVAHLGAVKEDGSAGDKHDKMDCRRVNLAALCQRCHLNFDRDEHVANARETRRRKREEAGQLRLVGE